MIIHDCRSAEHLPQMLEKEAVGKKMYLAH